MDGSNETETERHEHGPHGAGSIDYDKKSGRWRLRWRNAPLRKPLWFATREAAERHRNAIAVEAAPGGTTVRQLIDVYVMEHDLSKAVLGTISALITCDPVGTVDRGPEFIDEVAENVEPADVAKWAVKLVGLSKTRSVLDNGERTLIQVDGFITRPYAKSALSALRCMFEANKNRDPQLVTKNPAADIGLPSAKNKNGKKRTKKVKRTSKVEFLPQADCARVFFCEACEQASGVPRTDLEQLVRCQHVPFFYRVAHSVSIMQGLREGEIAAQRWERLCWVASSDWTGHSWTIEASWMDDSPKNGQDRAQALIPMAARLLHRWWQFKGCPKSGLLFCTADASSKGSPLGELAQYVAAHPKHTNRDLFALAQREGVPLTLRRIETLRSEARRRASRKASQQDQMFARGYDFGWFDTKYNVRLEDGTKELRVREGWRTKLGLSARTRFHENRDTAATHLLSGTWGVQWTMQQVSDFLGHSDIKVTQDRYAHVTDKSRTEAAAAVDPSLPAAERARVDPSEIARFLPGSASDASDENSNNLAGSGKGTRTPDQSVNRHSLAPGDQGVSPKSGQCPGNVPPAALEQAKRLLEAAARGESLLAVALQLAGTVLEAAEPKSQDPVHTSPVCTNKLRLVR